MKMFGLIIFLIVFTIGWIIFVNRKLKGKLSVNKGEDESRSVKKENAVVELRDKGISLSISYEEYADDMSEMADFVIKLNDLLEKKSINKTGDLKEVSSKEQSIKEGQKTKEKYDNTDDKNVTEGENQKKGEKSILQSKEKAKMIVDLDAQIKTITNK
jgi:lipopolysaccharide export LptBFGC system permease protein LptF